MAIASKASNAVPTRAFAMPPPGCPNSACGFVKKSQLIAPAPRRATEITTTASTATATSAATVARTSMVRLTNRRRR